MCFPNLVLCRNHQNKQPSLSKQQPVDD
jgi:hypothetical protein